MAENEVFVRAGDVVVRHVVWKLRSGSELVGTRTSEQEREQAVARSDARRNFHINFRRQVLDDPWAYRVAGLLVDATAWHTVATDGIVGIMPADGNTMLWASRNPAEPLIPSIDVAKTLGEVFVELIERHQKMAHMASVDAYLETVNG